MKKAWTSDFDQWQAGETAFLIEEYRTREQRTLLHARKIGLTRDTEHNGTTYRNIGCGTVVVARPDFVFVVTLTPGELGGHIRNLITVLGDRATVETVLQRCQALGVSLPEAERSIREQIRDRLITREATGRLRVGSVPVGSAGDLELVSPDPEFGQLRLW